MRLGFYVRKFFADTFEGFCRVAEGYMVSWVSEGRDNLGEFVMVLSKQ